MSADGTLDLIDGALRDYETSSDAMRWTPDKAVITGDGYTRGGMQGMTPSFAIFDECTAFRGSLLTVGRALEHFAESFAGLTVTLSGPLSGTFSWCLFDGDPKTANQRPLAINGAEYRRRQKARRRR